MPSKAIVSTDPATGEVVGQLEAVDASGVGAAIDAARAAQPAWAALPLHERGRIVERFARLLLERRHDAATLITREMGKPRTEALLADVMPTLELCKFLTTRGAAVLHGESFRLSNPLLLDRRSEIRHDPLGVVGVISPWNYPLSIPASGVVPALFAGNAVVLKPANRTGLIAKMLVDLLHEAGVPDAALQFTPGPGATTGRAITDGGVDGILFTGSVEVGREVAAAAAKRFVPVALELGGKDPMVVLDDARLELAVRGALWGAYTNAGQTCAAVERVYVHRSLYDPFVRGVTERTAKLRLGNGLQPDVDMGPLVDDAALRHVKGQIDEATKRGATATVGGKVRQDLGPRFLEPTVLTGVDHGMDVMRTETFGPVLPVMPFDSVEEAVGLANDSAYGLCASVWSSSTARAREVGTRLKAGTVTLNDCVYTYAAAETPWGGVRDSGIGFSHGRWGLEAVVRLKHINTSPPKRAGSPWYYPYDADLGKLMDDGLVFLYGGARGKARGAKVIGALLKRFRG